MPKIRENNEGETDTLNLSLESDKRFGPISSRIARWSRKRLVKHQQKQQSDIEARLEGDDSVEFYSFIRDPNGTGGDSLSNILVQESEEPQVILLANGIVNPRDIIQISPFLEKVGMKCLRLTSRTRAKIIDTLEEGICSDTTAGYTINTIKAVQGQLFDDKKCKVIMIRNATKQDLHDSVQYGGSNTAVITIGHGTLGSVSMTDGKVSNTDIETPHQPLKAFIQHTCASDRDESEVMGERLAEKVYGWDRGTSPVDFIDDPLHLRK